MDKFWIVLASVMSVWAVVATFVNAKYAHPTAPKWKVILYTLIIDMPALYASVGKTGLIGKVTLPLVPSMTIEPKALPLPGDKP